MRESNHHFSLAHLNQMVYYISRWFRQPNKNALHPIPIGAAAGGKNE